MGQTAQANAECCTGKHVILKEMSSTPNTMSRSRIKASTPTANSNPITHICADCGMADPQWAILNRGVIVCHQCCQVHRSLGRHISQIRSLTHSRWNKSLRECVYHLYANGANNVWEHSLLEGGMDCTSKPSSRDPVHPVKADFIRSKYAHQMFTLQPGANSTTDELNAQLWSCVRTKHVETVLRLLVQGADANCTRDGLSPMHVAAREGQELQVELLYLFDADPSAPTSTGDTPATIAMANGHVALAERLRELNFECTDRLSDFLCGRVGTHRYGGDAADHYVIPQMSANAGFDAHAFMMPKRTVQLLPSALFEALVQDVYDEVDRRENDAAWIALSPVETPDQFMVPFLPVNPALSSIRNQSRQKLAKFGARDFANFVIDVLVDAKRRFFAASSGTMAIAEDIDPDESVLSTLSAHDASLLATNSLRPPRHPHGTKSNTKSLELNSTRSTKTSSSGGVTNGSAESIPTGKSRKLKASSAEPISSPLVVSTQDYMLLRDKLNVTTAQLSEVQKRHKLQEDEMREMSATMRQLLDDSMQMRMQIVQQHEEHELLKQQISRQPPQLTIPPPPVDTPPIVKKVVRQDTYYENGETNGATSSPKRVDSAVFELRTTNVMNPVVHRSTTTPVAKPTSLAVGVNDVMRHSASSPEYARVESRYEQRALAVSPDGRLQYPDNLIVQTEHLTSSITQLLADAQHGHAHSFPAVAETMSRVVDVMCGLVPAQVTATNVPLAQCLSAMCEAAVTLTIRCAAAAREHTSGSKLAEQSTCQAVQAAYALAKQAKELLRIVQNST